MSARKSKQERKDIEDALEAQTEAELTAEFGEPGKEMDRAERRAWARWMRKGRRVRFAKQLPKPPLPGEVEVLYAKLREELIGLNSGEVVMLVLGSQSWKDTVGAKCRELDAAASDLRRYDHQDDEKFLLWMRFEGERYVSTAHEKLQGYTQRFDRQVMGYDDSRPDHVKTRHVKAEKNRQMDGIPSRAEISRHKKWRFLEDERDALYAECFTRIVIEHAGAYPEFAESLRVLGFDGSTHKSKFTPGWKKKRNGEYLLDENGQRIRCLLEWEGGSQWADTLPESKRGNGMMSGTGHTGEGMPVCVRTDKINAQEPAMVISCLDDDLRRIRECIPDGKLGVITMDGLYATPEVRIAASKAGYVANTHTVSHGLSERTERHLAKREAKVYRIEGFDMWRANGLREVFCMCGDGAVSGKARRNADGSASTYVEGECDRCGDLHITAGDFYKDENQPVFKRMNPHDKMAPEDADWQLGNFLTRNDKRAKLFGNNRHAQGEGLNGHATTRFGLFKDGAPYKRIPQPHLDCTMTYIIMHALAMETRRRRKATADAHSDKLLAA